MIEVFQQLKIFLKKKISFPAASRPYPPPVIGLVLVPLRGLRTGGSRAAAGGQVHAWWHPQLQHVLPDIPRK